MSPTSVHVHAALRETLTTMSAHLVDDPRLCVPLPRNRLDAEAMTADPTIAAALGAAAIALAQADRPG